MDIDCNKYTGFVHAPVPGTQNAVPLCRAKGVPLHAGAWATSMRFEHFAKFGRSMADDGWWIQGEPCPECLACVKIERGIITSETLVGMFRTGATKETHGDCFLSHFTAVVFEVQPDKFLVGYPMGLDYRRPEWLSKDKLISWVRGPEGEEKNAE